MSTSESHAIQGVSTHFVPPAGVADYSIKGYRPDTSVFMSQLRKRQPRPFTTHISWQTETRLLARYCTDPEFGADDLRTALKLRSADEMRRMAAHYGVDYQRRNHANVAPQRQQTAREAYDQHRRACKFCTAGRCIYARQMRERAEREEVSRG